jgi:alpha-glucosidase (family GH31 glycosyl hydrolase)|eukprot:COSAG06_NODE_1459_length_9400_cov_8.978819_2_plen_214_part_00
MPFFAGIPLTGADMHSGTGPEDPPARIELAIRTLQVGALAYPFFRNHAGQSDGYFLPSNISGLPVPPLARAAITLRYNLLPHLYSLFVDVSRRGGTVVTPLSFEFPTAGVTNVSTQFMLGGLMVCPVLAATLPGPDKNVTRPGVDRGAVQAVPDAEVVCIFPQCSGEEDVRWFDWHTLAMQPRARTATVTAPIDTLPVFLRSGRVVVTQLIGE